jgi:hypothetical protein
LNNDGMNVPREHKGSCLPNAASTPASWGSALLACCTLDIRSLLRLGGGLSSRRRLRFG